MISVRTVLFAFVLLLGFYTGLNILPYRFSKQRPIDVYRLSGSYDPSEELGVFHGMAIRSRYIAEKPVASSVLGASASNKRIEVDLANQRLYALEGETKVFDFLISSGKWAPTPTGEFTIWIKLRYTKMEGGNKAFGTYYYLPNVPYVMFFANRETPTWRGFGLHGTYWHDNFGHPMSHGCVNMRTEDAEKLYYWVQPDLQGKPSVRATDENPGTRVVIYGTTPRT